MSPRTRPVARSTWQAAAALAHLAPEHQLPCPGCAASVRGSNLTAHVHRSHLSSPGAIAAGHPIHVGTDRRLRRTARWAAGLWLVAVAGLAAADPGALTAATTALGEEPTAAVVHHHAQALAPTPGGLALLAGMVVAVVGRLARRSDRARARLAVTDREVVLRHRYGTGIVRVALPARVEAGTLVRRVGARGGGEDGGPAVDAHDERVGSYIRVGRGRRAITVGCPEDTRPRTHWTGWAPGPARRRWDVTLSPVEHVAFQYALAAAGALLPRPA